MTRSDMRFYRYVFLRRLPILVGVAAVCVAAAAVFAYLQKPTFRSDAKILIAAPQIEASSEKGGKTTGVLDELQQLQQRIMARSSLLDVAERTGVYRNAPRLSTDEMVADMRKRTAISEVHVGVGRGDTTAFSISFDAEDARLAASVANELASRMVAGNARARTERATDTLRFFDGEVDRLGNGLTEMEGRILAFTNEHKDALPESLEFRRSQQMDHQERLARLQREEAEQRSRRGNLVRTFEAGDYAVSSARASPREARLADLQEALEVRRASFADTSPSVVALQNRIGTLRSEILSTGRPDGDKRAPSEVNVQLAEIDGRLVYIAAERDELTRQLGTLARSIESTPDNAAVLNALNRDYESVRSQYATAVARRADASMTKEIEAEAKGEHLAIVEAAVPAERPLKPQRLLIAGIGTAGGIGLGVALVILLEASNQTVRRPSELVRRLGIQPFVTIPHRPTRAETLRRKLRPVSMLVALVLACLALWLVVRHYPVQVDRYVRGATQGLQSR